MALQLSSIALDEMPALRILSKFKAKSQSEALVAHNAIMMSEPIQRRREKPMSAPAWVERLQQALDERWHWQHPSPTVMSR